MKYVRFVIAGTAIKLKPIISIEVSNWLKRRSYFGKRSTGNESRIRKSSSSSLMRLSILPCAMIRSSISMDSAWVFTFTLI